MGSGLCHSPDNGTQAIGKLVHDLQKLDMCWAGRDPRNSSCHQNEREKVAVTDEYRHLALQRYENLLLRGLPERRRD